jgi:hypothetical protein
MASSSAFSSACFATTLGLLVMIIFWGDDYQKQVTGRIISVNATTKHVISFFKINHHDGFNSSKVISRSYQTYRFACTRMRARTCKAFTSSRSSSNSSTRTFRSASNCLSANKSLWSWSRINCSKCSKWACANILRNEPKNINE